jgi:hypothetical protein
MRGSKVMHEGEKDEAEIKMEEEAGYIDPPIFTKKPLTERERRG